jgi:hypothetical protein
MRAFAKTFQVDAGTRILDVGGTPSIWRLLTVHPRITFVNLPHGIGAPDGFDLVFASGCALPFPDRSFDIVFSNSVIEHVGAPAEQQRFADEIRRVARRYWVQTPNRWFLIEPHLLTPFVHFLPRTLQRAIVQRMTVWQWIERPSPDRRRYYIEHYLNDIRLLSPRDLARLFPEAKIVRERWLGLTKSLLAVRANDVPTD